jgi:hypothetical protein
MPGTASKQFTVSTAAGGAFKLTDTPPVLGTYTYTARYAATSTTTAAAASRQLSVVRIPPALAVTTGATAFTYEPTIHVTAHLGATYRNRVVSIYAQAVGSGTRTLLKTGKVDAGGALSVSYRAAHSTRFTVVFAGDPHYAPRTITRTVYVRAKVTQSVSGYYGSTTIGGTVYYLFHASGTLNDLATVAPGKHGQCVNVEAQEFYHGSWTANASTGCVALSTASQVRAAFGLSKADHGVPYRVRADYIRSTNDISNLSNDSSWIYLEVET